MKEEEKRPYEELTSLLSSLPSPLHSEMVSLFVEMASHVQDTVGRHRSLSFSSLSPLTFASTLQSFQVDCQLLVEEEHLSSPPPHQPLPVPETTEKSAVHGVQLPQSSQPLPLLDSPPPLPLPSFPSSSLSASPSSWLSSPSLSLLGGVEAPPVLSDAAVMKAMAKALRKEAKEEERRERKEGKKKRKAAAKGKGGLGKGKGKESLRQMAREALDDTEGGGEDSETELNRLLHSMSSSSPFFPHPRPSLPSPPPPPSSSFDSSAFSPSSEMREVEESSAAFPSLSSLSSSALSMPGGWQLFPSSTVVSTTAQPSTSSLLPFSSVPGPSPSSPLPPSLPPPSPFAYHPFPYSSNKSFKGHRPLTPPSHPPPPPPSLPPNAVSPLLTTSTSFASVVANNLPSPVPSPSPSPAFSSSRASLLSSLRLMGFTDEVLNARLLQSNGGDLNAVVEWLLVHNQVPF